MGILQSSLRWVKQFVAGGTAGQDLDTASKARFVNSFVLVTYVNAAVGIVVSLTVYRSAWLTFSSLGFLVPVAAARYITVTRPNRLALAANLCLSVMAVLFTAMALLVGQASATTTWWLVIVPIVASQMIGNRAAIVWGIICAALVGFVHASPYIVGDIEPLRHEGTEAALRGQVLVLAFVSAVGVWARRNTDRYKQELQQANTELAAQKDAAELAKEWAVAAAEQLEAARAELEEANKAKSTFLANMSHEIRTPLNGVLGMTEILLASGLSPQQADYAGTIRGSGETLLTILNDILDISKIEAGKMTIEAVPFPFRHTLEDVVELFAERAQSKGLEIACFVEPDVPELLVGDPTRIRQIVSNLVNNAIKFTSDGDILVSARCLGRTAGGAGVTMHCSVADSGIGIGPDALGRLFQAFSQADESTTRKYGGTGLGLSICKQLTELMGGRVWAESEEGAGSTFHFEVELGVPAEEPALRPAGSVTRELVGRRCLVVDDNETNRRILTHQLQSWGMTVHVASSGPDALERLASLSGEGNAVELCILDMQMPEMDGATLARAIAVSPAEYGLPVRLMLSSMSVPLAPGVAESGGISRVLTKPVRQAQLQDAVIELLTGCVVDRRAERAPGDDEVGPELRAALDGLHVLVVEDNPVNARIASTFLEMLGCRADLASNGVECLELVAEAGRSYDVVLMDCQMPVMDGFAATRELRSRERAEDAGTRLGIVALTAGGSQGDIDACRSVGMDDFLAKPFKLADLAGTLARMVAVQAS